MYGDDGFEQLCNTVQTLTAQLTALITINKILVSTHQNKDALIKLLVQKEFEIGANLNAEPIPDSAIATYSALVAEVREVAERSQ